MPSLMLPEYLYFRSAICALLALGMLPLCFTYILIPFSK
jgi:hypothetical protein